ncbi:MAG: hypothetical protein ACOZD0_04625 [Pseudomonadota bacterium]
MTWPTSAPADTPVPASDYDAATDNPAAARAQLVLLKQRVDELSTALKAVIDNGEPILLSRLLASMPAATGSATLNRGARTAPVTLTWAEEIVIDCRLSNMFSLTLAGHTTLTLANAEPGQFITIRVKQGAAGNQQVYLSNNQRIANGPQSAANSFSYLSLVWDPDDGRFHGAWTHMPQGNQAS